MAVAPYNLQGKNFAEFILRRLKESAQYVDPCHWGVCITTKSSLQPLAEHAHGKKTETHNSSINSHESSLEVSSAVFF